MNNEEITRTLYSIQQMITNQGDLIDYMNEQIKQNEKDIRILKTEIMNLGGL